MNHDHLKKAFVKENINLFIIFLNAISRFSFISSQLFQP